MRQENHFWRFLGDNWFTIFLAIGMALVALYMGYLIGTSSGENPEAARYQVAILTTVSIGASLLITRLYAECAGSAGTGERALRVSVDAALRAGIFKASGSFDPMGFWDVRGR